MFLIGSPTFPEAAITVRDGVFHIQAPEASDENIYIQSARLNGRELDRAWLTTEELCSGGELVVDMGSEPSDWAATTRPPSQS